jgi:hypothetical protein
MAERRGRTYDAGGVIYTVEYDDTTLALQSALAVD